MPVRPMPDISTKTNGFRSSGVPSRAERPFPNNSGPHRRARAPLALALVCRGTLHTWHLTRETFRIRVLRAAGPSDAPPPPEQSPLLLRIIHDCVSVFCELRFNFAILTYNRATLSTSYLIIMFLFYNPKIFSALLLL